MIPELIRTFGFKPFTLEEAITQLPNLEQLEINLMKENLVAKHYRAAQKRHPIPGWTYRVKRTKATTEIAKELEKSDS